MNMYSVASLAGVAAFAFIVGNAEPRHAPAVEMAWVGTWSTAAAPMARRAHRSWLLRAMPGTGMPATLESMPVAEPEEPETL